MIYSMANILSRRYREGLEAPNPVDVQSFGGGYSTRHWPCLKGRAQYQYGKGCLSDGILGMGWLQYVDCRRLLTTIW